MEPILYISYKDKHTLGEDLYAMQWEDIRVRIADEHVDTFFTDGFTEGALMRLFHRMFQRSVSYKGEPRWDTIVSLLERNVKPIKTETDLYERLFGDDPDRVYLHPQETFQHILTDHQYQAIHDVLEDDTYIDGHSFRRRDMALRMIRHQKEDERSLALIPHSIPVHKELLRLGMPIELYRPNPYTIRNEGKGTYREAVLDITE